MLSARFQDFCMIGQHFYEIVPLCNCQPTTIRLHRPPSSLPYTHVVGIVSRKWKKYLGKRRIRTSSNLRSRSSNTKNPCGSPNSAVFVVVAAAVAVVVIIIVVVVVVVQNIYNKPQQGRNFSIRPDFNRLQHSTLTAVLGRCSSFAGILCVRSSRSCGNGIGRSRSSSSSKCI